MVPDAVVIVTFPEAGAVKEYQTSSPIVPHEGVPKLAVFVCCEALTVEPLV
jgi:hypothetical protein